MHAELEPLTRPVIDGQRTKAQILPAALALTADATWSATPGSGDFNAGTNWVGNRVPDGTATFGASSITSLFFSAPTTIGGWTFQSGAYSFTNANIVELNGAGITVNGGSAAITNNFALSFLSSSTAGTATIINNNLLSFMDSSTAGDFQITNNANLFFYAGTAANSNITNNADLRFFDSTAGDATITTTSGGQTRFFQSGSGANARFITQAGGVFDVSNIYPWISGTTAGSIEGAGSYVLGDKSLEVGANDASTEVSGVISGSGGSLTKTGTGTLILSGANTYTGTTDVDDGVLRVNGSLASSLTTINSGATLGGNGTLGDTTINGGTLAPGNSIGTNHRQWQPDLHPHQHLCGRSLSHLCRPHQCYRHGRARWRRAGHFLRRQLYGAQLHHPPGGGRVGRLHV